MPDILTKADYTAYEADVERGLANLEHVSGGPCPGCSDCLDCNDPENPSEDWHDLANEPHFSWSSCDVCGCTLGGNRHPVHGLTEIISEHPCPLCSGPPMLLGRLGNREHLRCRNCGMDYSYILEYETIHMDACVDCMYYVEYGHLDDTTMDGIKG